MQIKPIIRFFSAVFLLSLAVGCDPNEAAVPNRNDLIGTYTYHFVDKAIDGAADQEGDRLTLQTDGKYILAHGGPAKAESETEGVWRLVSAKHPVVLLDHRGLTVEAKGNTIRLWINVELGEWYERTR